MKDLTPEQVANFAYWLTEQTDLRDIKKYKGKVRIAFIENELLPEFLSKYNDGILRGWSN
jgi:hypothetical protein